MTARLSPDLPLHDDETAGSYVRRLSLFHSGLPANRLLADLGIDLRAFARGAPQAISSLAEAAGIEVARLMRAVISRSDRCRGFRGEVWSSDFVLLEGRRVCPVCLREDAPDGEAWRQRGRILWRLRPVLACPIHRCALVERSVPSAAGELGRAFPTSREVEFLPMVTECRTPTPLETMIASRVDDTPTGSGEWLDSQTLEQSARTCEMIGAVLMFGKKFKATEMSPSDWSAAGATGFGYARRGKEGIRAAFDEMLSIEASTAGQAGPRSGYGRLYEWLSDTNPTVDFGAIRQMLRGHILDHFAVKPGEMLLGEKVMRRQMHSVHSLAVNTGIHRKRLRKALVQLGHLNDDTWDVASHHLVVPAVVAEQISRDLKESVPLQLLPELLFCSRTQAESLYRDGVIEPLLDKDEESGIGRIAFARRTIQAFLKCIEALPLVETVRADEFVDLTTGAKKTGRSTGAIVEGILTGSVKAVRLSGEVGLVRVRVSVGDITALRLEIDRPRPRASIG
ncbi:TniQ family protein [Solirhodobacter olei]|uniref:TniQ family protein n=1 Tax=Solirhodobacter olei TaxID=2493082 RepID=UPI0013E2BF28|nr:TniQ family protein [Solirhodobacter olei]